MEMWLLEPEAAIRSPNQRDAFVDVLHTWILAAGPSSPLVASLTATKRSHRQQTPFQTPSGTIPPRMRFDELADVIREHGPSLAVEVTTAFLDRHPDWRERYGWRAMSAGVRSVCRYRRKAHGTVRRSRHRANRPPFSAAANRVTAPKDTLIIGPPDRVASPVRCRHLG